MWLLQVVSLLLSAASVLGTEVGVPERYLRPRNYNPHPLQTLLGAAPLRLPPLLLDQHPYQFYPRPDPRQEDSSPVQFPAVPETVKPSKSHTPGYISVPKNYAFAYAVKDRQSGDDFSHQQAHNGQSTKGEYRVKLPDGRTQIVSYTADKSGYKADVRYDEAVRPSGTGQVYYSPSYDSVSNSLQDTDYQEEPEVIYKQKVRILHKSNRVAQHYTKVQPTQRPLEVLFSPSPRPYKDLVPSVQYRALPQTAEEYTSSDTPSYYPSAPGYFASSVSSTAATPIVEDQDDVPAPPKPSAGPRFYSTTPAPLSVRYFLVPHQTQYVYSDS